MPPEGTDLVLASDVPDGEGDVLVLDGLHVETCGAERGKLLVYVYALRGGRTDQSSGWW